VDLRAADAAARLRVAIDGGFWRTARIGDAGERRAVVPGRGRVARSIPRRSDAGADAITRAAHDPQRSTWRSNHPRIAATRYGGVMTYEFLSDAWFTKVDELVAAAGDLQIPSAMKAVEVNVTVTSPDGDTPLFMKDGLFVRGHRDGAVTTLTLSAALARTIFIDGDTMAGTQGFLDGSIRVDGDLAKLVAMQTVEPSEAQKRLTRQIAAITR
jgi:hypothetical protein